VDNTRAARQTLVTRRRGRTRYAHSRERGAGNNGDADPRARIDVTSLLPSHLEMEPRWSCARAARSSIVRPAGGPSAQLVAGDSHCQHANNSELSGNSVNANKDSQTRRPKRRVLTLPQFAHAYFRPPNRLTAMEETGQIGHVGRQTCRRSLSIRSRVPAHAGLGRFSGVKPYPG
jgi:hypothetical protein